MQFDGVLTTVDRLTATFSTRLWIGDVETSPQQASPDPGGSVHVTLPLQGYVTVINTSTQPNAAAASVVVQYSVGYRAGSTVCDLLVEDQPPGRSLAGSYCWRTAGEVAPLTYSHGPPHSIEPGGGQSVDFGAPPATVAMELDVAAAQRDSIVEQLAHPAVIMATTNDIPGLGTSFRIAGACIDAAHGPTSPAEPNATPLPGEQHAIIGATKYLTCNDLPDLGS